MSLSKEIERAERDYNIGKGGDKFKIQDGDNRIRILSDFAALQNTYNGRTSVKFLAWVWDYASNGLKLAFLPYTIAKAVGEFEKKPDYAFTGTPMPYDIIISAKGAGTRDVEYSVIPARSNTPVPAGAAEALAKEKAIDVVRHTIHEQQQLQAGSDVSSQSVDATVPPTDEVNVEDTLK